MHIPQAQVRDFHRRVTGQPTSPAEPKLRNPELRARLILEKAIETVVALVGGDAALDLIVDAGEQLDRELDQHPMPPDLVAALDGVCDTIVVCYGTAEDIGVDLEPFYDEVMRTNMAKADGPINEHGKKLKPPGWQPPDIAGVLARARGVR